MRKPLTNNGKKLKSVHIRHLQVRDNEIRKRFLQSGKPARTRLWHTELRIPVIPGSLWPFLSAVPRRRRRGFCSAKGMQCTRILIFFQQYRIPRVAAQTNSDPNQCVSINAANAPYEAFASVSEASATRCARARRAQDRASVPVQRRRRRTRHPRCARLRRGIRRARAGPSSPVAGPLLRGTSTPSSGRRR